MVIHLLIFGNYLYHLFDEVLDLRVFRSMTWNGLIVPRPTPKVMISVVPLRIRLNSWGYPDFRDNLAPVWGWAA